jgi:hypothetical protein
MFPLSEGRPIHGTSSRLQRKALEGETGLDRRAFMTMVRAWASYSSFTGFVPTSFPLAVRFAARPACDITSS